MWTILKRCVVWHACVVMQITGTLINWIIFWQCWAKGCTGDYFTQTTSVKCLTVFLCKHFELKIWRRKPGNLILGACFRTCLSVWPFIVKPLKSAAVYPKVYSFQSNWFLALFRRRPTAQRHIPRHRGLVLFQRQPGFEGVPDVILKSKYWNPIITVAHTDYIYIYFLNHFYYTRSLSLDSQLEVAAQNVCEPQRIKLVTVGLVKVRCAQNHDHYFHTTTHGGDQRPLIVPAGISMLAPYS